MNFIRLIVWKEFLHIKADPLMSRLIVFPVLIQIFLMGYALTSEVKNTPIAILDHSNTPGSRSLVETIRNNELFKFVGMAGTEREIQGMLDKGSITLAFVMPKDFSVSLNQQGGAQVQIIADGVDANSSNVAMGYLRSVVSGWTFSLMQHRLAEQGIDINTVIPVTVAPAVLFNPMLKSSWYMIPGLVVILVTIITALLTGLSIVREKESGTFEQLMVTPIRPMDVVFGKIIPFVVIGLFEISIFLCLATLWFGIPFNGNILTLFFCALIYMISSLGIGIFTSTVVRNAQQVLFLTWFILIFFLLLSGFFIPIENMPAWVRAITYINPVRFFMFIVREIFLKGSGLLDLWKEVLNMFAIGIGVFGLALVLFRRKVA